MLKSGSVLRSGSVYARCRPWYYDPCPIDIGPCRLRRFAYRKERVKHQAGRAETMAAMSRNGMEALVVGAPVTWSWGGFITTLRMTA